MSLSSNLKNSSEPACLRATGSGVEYIDKLPHNRVNCIKLCLSYNSISSLENITQFKRLNVLLIQYNLISTFEALNPLKELRYLRTLHLEGNPVCDLAMFDIHVISMLPNLQLLNGKRTKEILEFKDLKYIDYEAELLEQIMHINFVYEVFKYALDISNRENIIVQEDSKRGNRNNSSSNTPSRSNRSALVKSSSPASVSSKQTRSMSSRPTNNPIYDFIKEAIKVKRSEILDNKSYKVELANSLRKNKFNDDGYISFLRLEVLRCDALIEDSITNLIKFIPQPSSPSRKHSVTSTPSKSPQSYSKDNSRQGTENALTVYDDIETFRSILSDLKGEEDFNEFVAQQDDLQALSFRMMGAIGGMDIDKVGIDASIGYNLTPTTTPKRRSKHSVNRNKRYSYDGDNEEEEEIEDNYNIAMTPSAEVREEKPGFAQKAPTRRAKTPAVSKKRNTNNVENSPDQKIAGVNPNKSNNFTTPQKEMKANKNAKLRNNDENEDENPSQHEIEDEFLFEKERQKDDESKTKHPHEVDNGLINSEDLNNDNNNFEVENDNENENASQNINHYPNSLIEEEEEVNDQENELLEKQLEQQKQLQKQREQERQEQLKQQKEQEEKEKLRKQQELEKQKQEQQKEQERQKQLQQLKQEQERQKQLKIQQQKEQLRKQQEQEKQKQKQEQLRKQQEIERQKQQQLLQQQKEQEEKEKLQKQQELEKQRKEQLLRQQQEQEKQRKEQLLREQKEQEEKEQLRKQQEKEKKQKLLQQQKEQEEKEKLRKQQEEKQRQQQLLQQEKEKEERERLQKQKEQELKKEQERQWQEHEARLLRQQNQEKQNHEQVDQIHEKGDQLHQKRQSTPKQQKQQRNRPNESDGDIDSDLQEIVKSCDTLNINKSSSEILEDENEGENGYYQNKEKEISDQVGQEEEEVVQPIIPIDMNPIISFEDEIFSSGSSDNEAEDHIDRHENIDVSSKRIKKIKGDENKNIENVSNDDQKEKEKEKENSIFNQSFNKKDDKNNYPEQEDQFHQENEFEIEEEEEELNDEVINSSKDQTEQSIKTDASVTKEDSRSKASNKSKDRNSEQNDQNNNSYSPSSSAGNFVFQEPLLSTGEKEEEEEEEDINKKSKKDFSSPKKCSIVVSSNTPISIAKENCRSSSECAEYLESGPDDDDNESNNHKGRTKTSKNSNNNKNQNQNENHKENHDDHQKDYDPAKKNVLNQDSLNRDSIYDFGEEDEEENGFEDHESNDLNNYVDNTATLSLDEKMQEGKEEEEEEEEQQRQFSNKQAIQDNHKSLVEDNGFDYSVDEIDTNNENSKIEQKNSPKSPNHIKNVRDNFDIDNNDGNGFPFTNASSDLRFGAFASSEKLNNSEENTDNYNFPNSNIIPTDFRNQDKNGVDDNDDISDANDQNNSKKNINDLDLLDANLSEDSDSFQRKMMNLVPQSIRKITEPQKQEQENNVSKQHKRSILFNFDQVSSSNKSKNKDSIRKEANDSNEDEIDTDHLINGEIDDMAYDASRGESMSSNKGHKKQHQKSKQKQKQNQNQSNQPQLDDFVDGTKFDAESGGFVTTPLQSPEYPNSSFQNRFDQEPEFDSFYQTKSKNQNTQKSRDSINDSSKAQKRNHHLHRNNTIDNEDYYSYADESRDFHENENENDNLFSYNYKRISDSKNDLTNFGSNAFDASNGGIDTTNVESNEPHWLNSCDDTKFDASHGGAYDSAQPQQKLTLKQSKQNKKQDIIFSTNNSFNNIISQDNDNGFISHDQSTENESQHQVRFVNAHRKNSASNQSTSDSIYSNKKNQVFGTFSESNSDLLNDEFEEDDDDNDEASSSRAATSAAFSSSINPSMKYSNSYLNMTQDNASSSRPEPDSEYRLKSDSQYIHQKGRSQIIPTSQLFVCKYFNFWKSRVKNANQNMQKQVSLPSTSTSATINDSSYILSSKNNSLSYSSFRNNVSSNPGTNNYSLKQMSERRELLRKIEMQKDINKALQARLNQIGKEIEVSENYSMAFEWPPSSHPSSPLASTIHRERIMYQQTQQMKQQQQKQKRKKERAPDLFTQYRNHVMSSSTKKE